MRAWRHTVPLMAVVAFASGCALDVEEGEQPEENIDEIGHPLEPILVVDTRPKQPGYSLKTAPDIRRQPMSTETPTPDPWNEDDSATTNPEKPTPDPWDPGEQEEPGGGSSEGSEE